ncbi:Hypothetical protein SRAE_1000162500 [Strongyloides ratti]|uniref:Uncharacterized protein n=1 Tax=Strongyloides ratti TaxID=34506 RepID=A0A090MW31_STRRB|nr:Hypothetical protein SRAE_1000162500 [Strongyloides ratti]CEF63363.1 Hypothetical protein SRAE_1000162500 [Strongyloides ratti]
MSEKYQKRCQLLLNRLSEILQNDTKEVKDLEEKIKKITEELKEEHLILQKKEKTERIIKRKIEVLKEKNETLLNKIT